MLFPTIQFALFFVVVLTANWLLLPHPTRWKRFMLVASYVFYGAWDWRFLGLLIGSTIFNQVMAVGAHRADDDGDRRWWLRGAVAGNLVALGWFKYYGFFASSLVNLLRPVGLDLPIPLLQITLPVGISFFTFQAMAYVIDVGRGRQTPSPLLEFAVFLAFFPQLVAGPIVRSSEFVPQLRRRRDPRNVEGSEALLLIAGGLFKKVVVANTLATVIVDRVFAAPGSFTGFEVLMAIYAYAIQIFADFSGYTDIAIGVALLMGFRFPQNFNQPYQATSLQDFWRRWHMTLSRWLRDYLYIPLGGNRGSRLATYRNVLLTMVLGGLWHGAAWTFVVWGTLHGGWLAAERWIREVRGDRPPLETVPSRVLGRLVTFHVVCLGWVFFRADSFGTAWALLGRLGHWGAAPTVTPTVLVLVFGALAAQFIPSHLRLRWRWWFGRLGPVQMGLALGGFLLLLDGLGPQGVSWASA